MRTETAREKLVELAFVRAVYQRISNIKVRDLLFEVAEVLKVSDPYRAAAYLQYGQRTERFVHFW